MRKNASRNAVIRRHLRLRKRSPVLPLARVSMFSVPWLTSTLRSSMMKLA